MFFFPIFFLHFYIMKKYSHNHNMDGQNQWVHNWQTKKKNITVVQIYWPMVENLCPLLQRSKLSEKGKYKII